MIPARASGPDQRGRQGNIALTLCVAQHRYAALAAEGDCETWGEPVGEVTVTFKEGKLFLLAQGQSYELGAYDDTTFALLAQPGVKFKFTFEGNKVNSMILIQGAQSFVLKRMEGK